VDSWKTADSTNPVDRKEDFPKCVPKDRVGLTFQSERLFNASVIAICLWALIEAPLELGGAINATALLALVASKVLIGLTGMATIANLRFARQAFTFICGASVFAIAPALPLEYARCVAVALLSTVECAGKAACVVAFAIASLAGDSVSEHLSARNRTANGPK
jgi:hypothetical protein